MNVANATDFDAASQHGPRPLPLFLAMLRSETAGDPGRMARAIAGLRAFQQATREAAVPPLPVVLRTGRVTLRDAGGKGPPVLFVPSLINPPTILDLPSASLVRWIAARGHRTLLLDWGTPGRADRPIDLAGHVEHFLLPLIARLGAPPVLVGYCLGGTLALAAAARARVAGVACIAAPWRFAGYGEGARGDVAALWRAAAPTAHRLGVVPMETLQAGFWQLDPARTIDKFAAFGAMDPGGAAARAFVRLEDWANAGEPLPEAAARDLFERFVGTDDPGRGAWVVGGGAIDPLALRCPAIEFVSLTDRIVPAATAVGLPNRHDVAAGHVGMIVGRTARTRLWTPLAEWIAALFRR